MKNKILTFIMSMVMFFGILSCNAMAYDIDEIADEVENIFSYEMNEAGVSDYDEYLATGLVPSAGTGAEWMVINMVNAGIDIDYSDYVTALKKYLDNNSDLKATDIERTGLALKTLGEPYNEDFECSDIMSVIYGLMLTKDETLAEELMVLQLEDGGFALYGNVSDVDVTAMALRSLVPFKDKYSNEIEKALERLSGLQQIDGGFTSFGQPNSESSAQVLMALNGLGIDFEKDQRFIKNGKNILDAIRTYKNPDGGYSHILGQESNALATCQVLEAYLTFGVHIGNAEEDGTGNSHNAQASATTHRFTGKILKIIIISVIALIIAISFIIRLISKKKINSALIIALIIGIIAIVYIILAKIEMPWEHYQPKATGDVATTIEITGVDGDILETTTVYIEEGDSAYTQLLNAVAINEISISSSGSEMLKNIYISSIDGLAEFDYGAMSGWKYQVNGEFPNRSCSDIKLNEGDEVIWVYTKGDE